MYDMIEVQCLNYVLTKKSLNFFTKNNLNETYFKTLTDEFRFIKKHWDKYGNVPDRTTILQNFPDFPFIEVNESEKYLLDEIIEANLFMSVVPDINKAVELMNIGKMHEASKYLTNISTKLTPRATFEPIDLIGQAQLRYDEYVEKCENITKAYVTTGFPQLDEIIGGWDRKDELAFICAKTNVGKSWFLLYFALQAAIKGLKVGIYSGEMSPSKLGYRIDTFLFNMPNWGITHGDLNIRDTYKENISKIQDIVNNSILVVTPEMLQGNATVSKLKSFVENFELDMLCIDQVSLMEDERNGKQGYENYANIAKDLKSLQTLIQKPILAVSQLGRTQADTSVTIEDIAGSYDISRYATIMLLLEQKDNDTDKVKRLVMTIGKTRDSEKGGKLTYMWDINYGRLTFVPTENDVTNGKHIEELKKEYGDMSSMGGNIF